MFIFLTFIHLTGVSDDIFMSMIGTVGITGVFLGIVMIIWTPGWAKPAWQRYLEENYTWQEIRGVFIPTWRKMNRREWTTLMDSEEGIEELVSRARQS